MIVNTLYLILNYKTYNETIYLIRELLSQDIRENFILVVDNCSPNESFIRIKEAFQTEKRIECIRTDENGGYAKGNNYGLRYAKKYNPKYICIINNDVHFDGRMVDRLAIIYEQLATPGLVSPIQYLPNNVRANLDLQYPSFIYDLKENLPYITKKRSFTYSSNTNNPIVQKVFLIPGAFIFCSYNVLELVGFFDEYTFLYGEERFLSYKIEKHNLSNYIILNERYIHEHSKTISSEASVLLQSKMMFDSRIKFAKIYRKDNIFKLSLLYITFYLLYYARKMKKYFLNRNR